jgi:DNA-directed RNA polymerase specialized sigma24 family protein
MTDTQGAARDYLATPPDAPSDARDWLKAQLAQGVPEYPDPLREFLDALPWRCRAVVVLLYAQHLTQDDVGYILGISRWSIRRDLEDTCILIRGLPK